MRRQRADARRRRRTRHSRVRASAHRSDYVHKRFGRTGRQGVRLARATINSAALVAMLEGGVFDELPKLRVVVTTLAIGGVLMVRRFRRRHAHQARCSGAHAPPRLCRHHGNLHPALVGSMVELIGADHVIAGTDWPIAVEKDVPARLQRALAIAGLSAEQQQMVAGGTTLKLLGLA